jgi:23S rRNA-/tRNA-specific pseudouridylate synthase
MNTANSKNSPWPLVAWGPGWLVVDKPAGTSVHNEPGQDICSRISQFLNGPEGDWEGFDRDFGLHPVHRLDKETSGLLLLAGQRRTFEFLAGQMAGNSVRKEYLAVVHGHPAVLDGEKWSVWSWSLSKSAAGRGHIQGKDPKVPCQTRFRILNTTAHYSLLRCHLVTGRRHQIRRHAALAGHPVIGDWRYGSKRACRFLSRHFDFTRLGLHAALLEIQSPGEKERRCFTSSDLPDAIQTILDADNPCEAEVLPVK